MSEFFLYLAIFVFGLIIGSFLNCLIYRLARPNFSLKNLGGLRNRSYCPKCKHSLKWLDLIPILSFLILRGRCRYCQKPISLQYPLVEFFTGILFVLIVNYTLPNLLVTGYWLLITCFLIVIFVYDLKHYIIPDKIIYPAIGIAFFYQFFGIWNFGIWNLGFGILPSLFFLAIILFSKGTWMGLGDFKLAILMGLILAWPNILVALFLAFFIGAIIGIGLIISGKKTLKSKVPFAPFLITGTFIALFWGEKIINWYWHFISLLLK